MPVDYYEQVRAFEKMFSAEFMDAMAHAFYTNPHYLYKLGFAPMYAGCFFE